MKNNKPLTILMTADAVGGVWTYAIDLATQLASLGGHKIHIATMGPAPSQKQIKQVESLENVFLHLSEYDLEWMEYPWEDVNRAGAWLLQLQLSILPDVIHLNNFCHGNLAWNAPVLMVAHSCVCSWWRAVKGGEATSYQTYFDKVKEGLEAADIIIAPTQHQLTEVYSIYGIDTPGMVISNATKIEGKGEKKHHELIVTMGRFWDEAKNIAAVEKAGKNISWPIMAIGDTGTKENKCFKNLDAIGWCEQQQIQDILLKAAIFVLPAKYEPFGLSILEAAKYGCALVLGNIPSLRENWEDAAMFVTPDDYASLATNVQYLIDNKAALQHYQRKAKERANGFSIEKTTEIYIEVYQKLISERTALKPSIL